MDVEVKAPAYAGAPVHGGVPNTDARLTCIDLFCGCGGFSLGMVRADFRIVAAIDFDLRAIEVFQKNFPNVPHILKKDLTKFRPEELANLLGTNRVDVVVGGPPCQGFSKVRSVDGSNNGKRLKPDSRRDLYIEFLRYVGFFRPRVFVMENVLGLRSAVGGEYFTAVQQEARALGYRVHPQIEDAWVLGVPQKRRRQLIIGVRGDLPGYFLPDLRCSPRAESVICLWDAIGDLPRLKAGSGVAVQDYDLARRERHLEVRGQAALAYLNNVLEIGRATKLTNHDARFHSERDLRDFARLREGESSASAMHVRNVQFEFPYDKSHFKDRYTRQSRWKPCSTIVAHLSKDGLMFIHPTQNRSLTPREAARVQSFPDWFIFPKSRTHAYSLIGNAVPPLVAEAVGLAVRQFLGADSGSARSLESIQQVCQETRENIQEEYSRHRGGRLEAIVALKRFANFDRAALRALKRNDLLAGWYALLYLFPDLHPGNALDHGKRVEVVTRVELASFEIEGLFSRRYARSGWPVALEPLGREIWRRLEKGQLTYSEVYCSNIGATNSQNKEANHNAARSEGA